VGFYDAGAKRCLNPYFNKNKHKTTTLKTSSSSFPVKAVLMERLASASYELASTWLEWLI